MSSQGGGLGHQVGTVKEVSDTYHILGRAKAALGLEQQIRDADKVIRGFESTLAQEAPIPDGPGALQERVSQLQVGAGGREGIGVPSASH